MRVVTSNLVATKTDAIIATRKAVLEGDLPPTELIATEEAFIIRLRPQPVANLENETPSAEAP